MRVTMYILLGMMFISGKIMAQETPSYPLDKNNKVNYSEVVDVPGTNKDKLFDRSLVVLADIYNQLEKKIANKDKAGGLIELNCSTRVVLKDPKSGAMIPRGFIMYKLKLQFKDGKYRYEFYDFKLDKGYRYPIEHFIENDQSVQPEDRGPEQLAVMDADIKSIIEKLKAGMKADKVKEKSDW